MKRQRVRAAPNVYVDHQPGDDDIIQLNETKSELERWMEAQILPEDTLQAIALRFNCTIAELKKINKIDKDNEIFARRIIRVPITPHSILLETLPKVHSSGNSSPKRNVPDATQSAALVIEKQTNLDEKLIVAAVSTASYKNDPTTASSSSPNGDDFRVDHSSVGQTEHAPLLSGEYDDNLPQPRPLKLPSNDFSCNGSDCDISWICLLVCILALCFAIPLIYVIYVAEHIEKYHHDSFINETTHHKT
uniref:LysM and putative peptidoglycan-binding domain-containing protein 4 n=1 Tax=Culex pipiens TaxID=7175 RepID=A0A8D8DFU5_CULPI